MWLLLFIAGCTGTGNGESGVVEEETACLGRDAHCDRALTEITVLMAHNAMANTEDDFKPPNHHIGLTAQLDLGVRGMMLDVYEEDGVVLLCHGYCSLGSRTLEDGLNELLAWLDAHPREVLQIIFQRAAPADEVVQVFEATGAAERAWTQVPGEPWPTVQEMLDAGTQLVVFDQNDPAGPSWYMHAYAHSFDNNYAHVAVDDFECEEFRGSSSNALYTLNHFISDPIAKPEYAAEANEQSVVRDHIEACEARWDRVVNHVAVDFVSVGDAPLVVQSLETGSP